MKILKRSATIALLLFVGATVGMLIAQEISHTAASPIEGNPSSSTAKATNAVASVETSTQFAPAGVAEGSASEAPPAAIAGSEAEPGCVVDAIYFHNTLRCNTCRTIEDTAKAVLEAEFSEELATGQMRWSAINMEIQQHYVEEFDLVKPTLILVRNVADQRTDWVALDETWSLIRSRLGFADYIENETRIFLEACP